MLVRACALSRSPQPAAVPDTREKLMIRTMKRRIARGTATATLVFTAGIGMATIPATINPTAADASVTRGTTPVRACTNLADPSCQQVIANLPNNVTVTMRCWRDESSYAGTARWFWVSGGGVEGFASANQVGQQTNVGHCNNDRQIQAVRWAGSRLGEDAYVNWCLSFVRDAWLAGAGRDIGSAYNAISYWKARPAQQVRGNTNPPAGALVFWNSDAYNADGHVAISIGGGRAISTYERSTRPIHIMSIAERNKTKPYLGYIMP